MSDGLLKIHHGIMKSDALADYKNVKSICEREGVEISEPKGKHWHKIEDATAEMLHRIANNENAMCSVSLHRGLSYYLTLHNYHQ